MKTLQDIYNVVEESGSESAFNIEEARAVWDILNEFSDKKNINIVEIGIQFGRSTSVIAEFVKDYPTWNFVAIDSWQEDVSEEARNHVFSQIKKHGWRVDVWYADSKEIDYRGMVDVIHIDGDHTYNGVMGDCDAWLPRVNKGGYVMFDDYGHASLPEVFTAVGDYMDKSNKFEFVGRYGEKLGIFRRTQ